MINGSFRHDTCGRWWHGCSSGGWWPDTSKGNWWPHTNSCSGWWPDTRLHVSPGGWRPIADAMSRLASGWWRLGTSRCKVGCCGGWWIDIIKEGWCIKEGWWPDCSNAAFAQHSCGIEDRCGSNRLCELHTLTLSVRCGVCGGALHQHG